MKERAAPARRHLSDSVLGLSLLCVFGSFLPPHIDSFCELDLDNIDRVNLKLAFQEKKEKKKESSLILIHRPDFLQTFLGMFAQQLAAKLQYLLAVFLWVMKYFI